MRQDVAFLIGSALGLATFHGPSASSAAECGGSSPISARGAPASWRCLTDMPLKASSSAAAVLLARVGAPYALSGVSSLSALRAH